MQCAKKSIVSLIRSDHNLSATAWEAPDIHAAAELVPQEPELTPEEIALQQAYEEGLAKGHAEGFEKGRQEGFDTGRNEGLQQTQEQGRQQQELFQQQAAETLSELEALARALQSPLESQLDETVNHAIATLVVQISRQVVKNELSIKPEHIVTVVNELFQKLPMTEREVRFHLHPEDKELLESETQMNTNGFQWLLESDETITRGGCHVESHNFSADERVEQRLEQAVLKVFGEFPEDALESSQSDLPDKEASETEAAQGESQEQESQEPAAEAPVDEAPSQAVEAEGPMQEMAADTQQATDQQPVDEQPSGETESTEAEV